METYDLHSIYSYYFTFLIPPVFSFNLNYHLYYQYSTSALFYRLFKPTINAVIINVNSCTTKVLCRHLPALKCHYCNQRHNNSTNQLGFFPFIIKFIYSIAYFGPSFAYLLHFYSNQTVAVRF